MWLIDTIWTIGGRFFPLILSNFSSYLFNIFLYHSLENFRANYACPSFFCISCGNLCRISIFDCSGEWHCVRCIASAILKSDTLNFVFVACLESIIAFEIHVFNNNSEASFIYHLRVPLCGVEYAII